MQKAGTVVFAEITAMVMVMNDKTDEVLVIDRLKKYKGISFPGGHAEAGESFYETAVREIREETGLVISELKHCGIINWCKKDGSGRYIEFLYKTSVFSGTLLKGTDEGRIFWLPRKELYTRPLSANFAEYLPVFFSDTYTEALGEWTDDDNFTGIKYFS